jgi:YesN/AraC family two-component response regulator
MAQSARLKPATILIVENEAIVRLELAARLTDLSLIVLSACNADEAIALLDAHPEIEVLLTDIKMPGSMDGVRLAHHVRDRWPPVKIIVTSGFVDAAHFGLPLGSLFMAKPYDSQTLKLTLARLMAGLGLDPSGLPATA